MPDREWVHIEFDFIERETDKALLVQFSDMDSPIWLPLSQIEDNGEAYRQGDREGSMCITKWIADQKGLSE